jgi:hypothetical protein
MRTVFRRLGKTLALVAVMASALNAHCVLSCSLQSLAPGAPHSAHMDMNMDMDMPMPSGHDCCHGPEQSKPSNDQTHQPCSDPLLLVASLNAVNAPQLVVVVQPFDPSFVIRSGEISPVRRSVSWPAVVDPVGTFDPPAFSILRI